jgi:transcriptional regulator of arginine metabolism
VSAGAGRHHRQDGQAGGVAGGATTIPAPRTKAARQAAVAGILSRQSVCSQAELARALAGRGIEVAQATLSRDLDELGATKVRQPDGGSAYAVPADAGAVAPSPAAAADRLARRCAELLVAAEGTAHLAVLHTPPGGAHLLASAVDAAALAGVLGCVAGDDTVVIVCRDAAGGPTLAGRIRELAQPAVTPHHATRRAERNRSRENGAGRMTRRARGVNNTRSRTSD